MHRFKVEKMGCGGCAKSVTRAVLAVEPNARVEVDLGYEPLIRPCERLDLPCVGRITVGPFVVSYDLEKSMKRIVLASATLLLLAASPAMAMSCCGGKGKGAMMCGKAGAKGAMAMNHGAMKGKKGGCCCEGMSTNMSRRG